MLVLFNNGALAKDKPVLLLGLAANRISSLPKLKTVTTFLRNVSVVPVIPPGNETLWYKIRADTQLLSPVGG